METTGIRIIIKLCLSKIQDAYRESLIKLNDYSNKKIKTPFTDVQQLYHYCSLETFYNIIESNCFWLSHTKFMNDVNEANYSIEVSKQFLQEYSTKNGENDNLKKLHKLINSNLNTDEQKSKELDKNININEYEYEKLGFFTCFSSIGDKLEMWNLYGGKNIGISMGLDFSRKEYFIKQPVHYGNDIKEVELSPFYGVPHYYFSDIEYDDNKVKQTVYDFLDSVGAAYNTLLKEYNNYKNIIDEIFSNETANHLKNLTNNLKNRNFSYENEIRFTHYRCKPEDIKFRVKDKFIVPYIEFPLEEKEVEEEVEDENKNIIKIKKKIKKKIDTPVIPITSVTLSPGAEEPELVLASIRSFLKYKGYNTKEIEFNKSTVAFRQR